MPFVNVLFVGRGLVLKHMEALTGPGSPIPKCLSVQS